MPVSRPAIPDTIEWEETRTTRSGEPALYLLRGRRLPGGWLLEERETWDTCWLPVPPSQVPASLARAQRMLHEAAGTLKPAGRPLPELGSYRDNVAALRQAQAETLAARYDVAAVVLDLLQQHLSESLDPKNRRLLVEVQELRAHITARRRAASHDKRNQTAAPAAQPAERTFWRRFGARTARQRDQSHVLKQRLIEAALLSTAFAYTIGLVGHEIASALPSLTSVSRNVLAASVLGTAWFLIRLRGS
jgi:hypothetical protein